MMVDDASDGHLIAGGLAEAQQPAAHESKHPGGSVRYLYYDILHAEVRTVASVNGEEYVTPKAEDNQSFKRVFLSPRTSPRLAVVAENLRQAREAKCSRP